MFIVCTTPVVALEFQCTLGDKHQQRDIFIITKTKKVAPSKKLKRSKSVFCKLFLYSIQATIC